MTQEHEQATTKLDALALMLRTQDMQDPPDENTNQKIVRATGVFLEHIAQPDTTEELRELEGQMIGRTLGSHIGTSRSVAQHITPDMNLTPDHVNKLYNEHLATSTQTIANLLDAHPTYENLTQANLSNNFHEQVKIVLWACTTNLIDTAQRRAITKPLFGKVCVQYPEYAGELAKQLNPKPANSSS